MTSQLHHIAALEHFADLRRAADRHRLPPARHRDEPHAGGDDAGLPTDVLVLPDGSPLWVRTLGSGDRRGLAALFARLSPQSRYRRYLSPKPELTPRELTHLTDVDHVGHEAYAAVDPADGSIVGVSRYVAHPGSPGVADLSVEVADDLQRRGIGTALTRRIVQQARINRFALLTATTLSENRPARALLHRLEFRPRARHGSEIELELRLS